MSSLFPLRGKVDLDDRREPRLIDLDEEVADEVFEALSSATTRQIFAELHETPGTASDLADVTDTSVQNVQYHLRKLQDADLVEVVDTWYSERGTEMKVYAPTDESLVLFAGGDKRGSLRSLLERAVGVLAVLLPVSAAVAWLARRVTDVGEQTGSGADGGYEAAGDGGDPVGVTSGGGDGARVDSVNGTTPAADQPTPARESMQTPAPEPQATATPEPATTPAPDGGDGGSTPTDVLMEAADGVTPTPDGPLGDIARETVGSGGDPAVLAGAAFFFGGLFVLTLVAATWYWRG